MNSPEWENPQKREVCHVPIAMIGSSKSRAETRAGWDLEVGGCLRVRRSHQPSQKRARATVTGVKLGL